MKKLPTKGIHHNLMSFFLWSTKMNTNQDNHVIIKSAAKNFEPYLYTQDFPIP